MFVVLAAAALTRGDGAGHPAPSTVRIDVQDLLFTPAEVEVHAGDTIVWINHDIVPHTVTHAPGTDSGSSPDDRRFDSGAIPDGGRFEWAPAMVGAVDYVCLFHPTMTGRLLVRPRP